ncbi:hypothetical protein DICPUDRAFT_97726 [Dictyostelium purpureum]|uniref:CRAL-TRIO domain-containing protein n=1 Tax=Dictyostelium purpureum TaxID=5786 RepID=F0ZJA6_DICPU|nr:uncharacterized protein DICPUDRAFT_97726 [Dictyostelium purpureum]EGC35986.1 hypothetical protein DICPUDRAFT_97726 [Dictyostelium purpureum]|eukprot:XP_003287487.1 hypothetical protein DICPUDRAFT_97726 [Dictyostelium purpureum]
MVFVNEEFPILKDLTNEEINALNQLKKNGICKDIEDQYLLMFLFSKKLDIENTLILIKNNLLLREKLNLPLPVVKEHVNQVIAKKASAFSISGKTDKQGRVISYLHPSKIIPKEYPFKEYMTLLFWNMDQTVHEHSSIHRSGICIIEDLHKMSILKHFDSRLNDFLKKNKVNDMQNVFIGRIQKIYIINPPFLLRPLLALGKTFVKSKIISRIEIVKTEQILNDIDPSQVLTEYGGSLSISYSDYFDSLPANY